MRNRLLVGLVLAALSTPMVTQARFLTPEESLQLVKKGNDSPRKVKGDVAYTLIYQATDSLTSQPTVYVFAPGNGEGFIVSSASDLTVPVLGYSDSGTIDESKINPEFKYWLDCYSQAIMQAESTGTAVEVAPAMASRTSIAPLVQSQWNQSTPYNNECPIVAGGRSVTGCVATAFAQIMYYHKWPKTAGKGSNSYSWTVNNTTYNESMDFSTVTFDWANMTNTYSSSSTSAQNAAVAKLMHAVGVGANMGYTPQSSGAVTNRAAQALLEYWDYDKGAAAYSRSSFSLDDWTTMIYNELAANRPVIYDGQSSGGGHCFICDGYNASNGYFHFNWGWGGYCDGYYVVTNLTPSKGGIGGTSSDDGYNQGQGIVIGLQPAKEGSTIKYNFELRESLAPAQNLYDKSSWIYITGQYYNASLTELTFVPGVKLVDVNDPTHVIYDYYCLEQYFDETEDYWGPMPCGNYYSQLPVRGLAIPAGTWDLYLVYRVPGGEWQDFTAGPDIVNHLRVRANADYVAFNDAELPTQEKHLWVIDNFNAQSPLYTRGSYVSFTGKFHNPSGSTVDFNPGIKFTSISDPDKCYYYFTNSNFSLKPQYYYSGWDGWAGDANLPNGEYIVTPAYKIIDSDRIVDFDNNTNYKYSCVAKVNSEYVAFDSELPGEPINATIQSIVPATATDKGADGTIRYYIGHTYTINYTVTSTGNGASNWSSYLRAYLSDAEGTTTALGSQKSISYSTTYPLTYSVTFTLSKDIDPADYTVTLWRGNKAASFCPLNITPEYDPDMSYLRIHQVVYGGISPTNDGTGESTSSPLKFTSGQVDFGILIRNLSKTYTGNVRAVVYGKSGSSYMSEAYADISQLTWGDNNCVFLVIHMVGSENANKSSMRFADGDGQEEPSQYNTTWQYVPVKFYSGRTTLDKDKLYFIDVTDADGNNIMPRSYFMLDSNATTGVESVNAETVDEGEAVYYDLSGRRVDNPTNGLYIKMVDGKASKVLIK